MAGMRADPGELGDHHRHSLQGPQVGVKPVRTSTLQQGLGDLGELGGRQLGSGPVGPRLGNASTPPWAKRACQTWARWRDPPSSLATSAWVRPWANSSAAWSRRASRAARCSAGRGRRVVGIAGPSHSSNPAVNPTHETQ